MKHTVHTPAPVKQPPVTIDLLGLTVEEFAAIRRLVAFAPAGYGITARLYDEFCVVPV